MIVSLVGAISLIEGDSLIGVEGLSLIELEGSTLKLHDKRKDDNKIDKTDETPSLHEFPS